MREIPLTQGKVVRVGDRDYAWLMQTGPWWAKRDKHVWYARARFGDLIVPMHTAILGTFRRGKMPDHIGGKGLCGKSWNGLQSF